MAVSEFDESCLDFLNRLTAARGGSQHALGELLENWRNYLLLLANRGMDPQLRTKAGASDVVQETFMRAQRGFQEFRGSTEGELVAWLRTILRNNLANLDRNFQRTDKRELDREVHLDDSSNGLTLSEFAGSIDTPSEQVRTAEDLDQLEQAIRALPDDYRQAIILRHQEGCSFSEIGTAMNRSTEAARKLWSRAIDRLTKQLESNDERPWRSE